MRDIATATLSGNLTRDVELRAFALRGRCRPAAGGHDNAPAKRRGVDRQDQLFTVEVYGAQARSCAAAQLRSCIYERGRAWWSMPSNLQTASVLVHVDLPWVTTGLEQRVGWAARPGAKRAWVQTYIPYIRGGGIEHVVSVLAERGAEHHQVLDSFEGVRAAESTVATRLGEITGQVTDSEDGAG